MSAVAHPKHYLPASVGADFLTTHSGRRCISMLTFGTDPRTLLGIVYSACLENVPKLYAHRMYLARELCGAHVWSAVHPNCAGMCLAFLVRRELLPLTRHTTRTGRAGKHYWIDPVPAPTGAL